MPKVLHVQKVPKKLDFNRFLTGQDGSAFTVLCFAECCGYGSAESAARPLPLKWF
jgi:hypothetical protein